MSDQQEQELPEQKSYDDSLAHEMIGHEITKLVNDMLTVRDHFPLRERHSYFDRGMSETLRKNMIQTLDEFVYNILQFLPEYFISNPDESHRFVTQVNKILDMYKSNGDVSTAAQLYMYQRALISAFPGLGTEALIALQNRYPIMLADLYKSSQMS